MPRERSWSRRARRCSWWFPAGRRPIAAHTAIGGPAPRRQCRQGPSRAHGRVPLAAGGRGLQRSHDAAQQRQCRVSVLVGYCGRARRDHSGSARTRPRRPRPGRRQVVGEEFLAATSQRPFAIPEAHHPRLLVAFFQDAAGARGLSQLLPLLQPPEQSRSAPMRPTCTARAASWKARWAAPSWARQAGRSPRGTGPRCRSFGRCSNARRRDGSRGERPRLRRSAGRRPRVGQGACGAPRRGHRRRGHRRQLVVESPGPRDLRRSVGSVRV